VELIGGPIAQQASPGLGALVAPLLIFVVLGGALVTWVVVSGRQLRAQGHDPSRLPPKRDIDHEFDPATSKKVRGGGRVGSWNATMPLVTLTADSAWVRLSGALKVWIDREDVTHVQAVRTAGGSGIRFASRSGAYDGVVFWCSPSSILPDLQRFGWPT
jgi:hypothetical protein